MMERTMRLSQYFQKWRCSVMCKQTYKITIAGNEACLSIIRQHFYEELRKEQFYHILQIKSFPTDSAGIAYLHIFSM